MIAKPASYELRVTSSRYYVPAVQLERGGNHIITFAKQIYNYAKRIITHNE